LDFIDIQKIVRKLHKKSLKTFEALDNNVSRSIKNWRYKDKGGGKSIELHDGNVIEKGAVNFSSIEGKLIPGSALASRIKSKNRSFKATGISIVIHPQNPYVPCSHLNLRYFELGSNEWWFGGGFDLTPVFPYEEDIRLWHASAKNACDKLDKKVYKKFKKECDEYFYLKHRDEKRGIGGIFFDKLNVRNKDQYIKFIGDVLDAYLESYCEITKKRSKKRFNKSQKDFQLFRRGRYVEFNLLYDRGTVFGLQSGGRSESILMSLPPLVKWSSRSNKTFLKYETNLKKYL
tara:strand:- start:967 stop:1833 length:867 start_codon:yes stop_codon:yes gene_type:complete